MHRLSIIMALAALLLSSCSDRPDYVLSKHDMASLMVDVHKGESIVEMQRAVYGNDSMRKLMKQSVYLSHGVTEEQVDSSFIWYGNHIEDYIEVYKEVVDRLKQEQQDLIAAGAQQPVFAVGDSVDVWSGPHMIRVDSNLPIKNVVFDIARDDDWEKGDVYNLQFKVVNLRQPTQRIKGSLFIEYDDGKIDYRTTGSLSEGWVRLPLATDTSAMLKGVNGFLMYDANPDETIYLDSISLVRTRFSRTKYNNRATAYRISAPIAKMAADTIGNLTENE